MRFTIFISLFLTTACSGSYPAGPDALDALSSSDTTVVSVEEYWISFTPVEPLFETHFAFYPGGKVEAEAYAPILRQLADAGVQGYILYVPRDLAILNSDAVVNLMDYTDTDKWLVSGHSLGGVAAAKMADEEPRVQGLSLWASYPAGSVDLSSSAVVTQSIVGSEDAVLNWDNWEGSSEQLPSSTSWVTIDGGNHAQFGDYGEQEGDGPALIDASEQWSQTTQAILSLLTQLDS